jgi:hypothetical protein
MIFFRTLNWQTFRLEPGWQTSVLTGRQLRGKLFVQPGFLLGQFLWNLAARDIHQSIF